MNCNEFETLVNDLVRKRVIDVSLRDATQAHARECARCNARLIEEQQLTVGLRALAILDENKKAPADLETSLLAAFRKTGSALSAQDSAIASPSIAASRSNRWWLAAAAILLLFALAAWRFQAANQQPKVPEQIVLQPTPQEPSPKQNEDKKRVPEHTTAPDKTAGSEVGLKKQNRQAPAVKSSSKDLARLRPQIANNNTREITTPFISLTQGYSLAMPEGGQVVRVELPRSALASFGLPVNAQRLNEPVKADVVVGNDGIARAIRFVR
jgi:hypothetical protein